MSRRTPPTKNSGEPKVIIAGVNGVIGRAAAKRLLAQSATEVFGLSRRLSAPINGVKALSIDLLDAKQVHTQLSTFHDVTHIIFAAYIEKQTAAEKNEVNVAILRNLIDVVESTSPTLQHITFYQGGKVYGADLGPFRTPAREDDPRLMPPNFYYGQEDLLRERQQGNAWSFTALRPEAVCGFATGNPMNLMMVIAIYAAISKELGIPLRFPGTEAAFRALYQVTSADILAEAADWAGTSPHARNQIFNLTNGDQFRWQHLWPKIAGMFGMECAGPVPMPLATYMADKGALWERMVTRHQLQPIAYDQLVSWPFGDFIFASGFDNISSTIKARQAGFHSCIDTEQMFRQQFEQLQRDKVIPKSA